MLGGVPTAVETARQGLVALGHDVVVIAPRMRGTPRDEPHVVRVPAVPAPTYPDFALPLPVLPGLQRAIGRLHLDVFHAHHPFLLGRTARALARRAGRPLVFTHHTLYDKYAHYVPLPRTLVARRAIAWSRRFANSADLVIVPSTALAGRLVAQGVRRPVEVVPTGVDLAVFRPAADRRAVRGALGLPLDRRLLVYVGRLDREKNLGLLLDTFATVARAHPAIELVLVGCGTQETELRGRVTALRVDGRVRFTGGVPAPDVARYYQAGDCFVFTSTTETQGLAVLEAMAAGLPVVAVRATGVEETVVDGVTGLLVPEDRDGLAAAILSLLRDEGLAAKLAGGAREAALSYGAVPLAGRLVALYRRFTTQRAASMP
jgi:glycosyltransferase involved in cell wall biosynthesis